MSVTVSVEVVSDQGEFMPGTAIVTLDGKVIAKLRGGEGMEVVVGQAPLTRKITTPALSRNVTSDETEAA